MVNQHTPTAAEDVRRRAHVRANWLTDSDKQMADFLGVTVGSIEGLRHKLGLKRARSVYNTTGKSQTLTIPGLPAGYTPEQLAWAHEWNGVHPEAGMMLVMHRDFMAAK